MKNKDIHDKIHRAVSHSVPDVLDRVLHDCATLDKQSAARKPVARRRFQSLYAASAMIVMLAVALIGINIQTAAAKVDSLIFLDVNPSIEISVDKDENVLQVKALNEDADKIIQAANLDNLRLNATVDSLVDSLINNGYLRENTNSILVSVQNADSDKNIQLQTRLTNQITAKLQACALSSTVVSQTLTEDNEALNNLAKKYRVSPGKAKLIQSLVETNTDYTVQNLADRPINELLQLRPNKPDTAPPAQSNRPVAPPANEQSYINSDAAIKTALDYAKTDAAAVTNLMVERIYKNNKMVYEIKFTLDNTQCEIDVNAHSGIIIRYERSNGEDINPPNNNNNGAEKSITLPPSANDAANSQNNSDILNKQNDKGNDE